MKEREKKVRNEKKCVGEEGKHNKEWGEEKNGGGGIETQ